MKAIVNSIRSRLDSGTPSCPIQILSDLHLEVCQQYLTYTFPVSAPFLLLAGDIGRLIDYDGYLAFLEAQVARYNKVFLVLGNHEFYELGYESAINEARRLAEEPSLANKVVLLHRTRWDDPESDLTILGCSLWSAIPDESYAAVESVINDFKYIEQWTAQTHNAAHADDVAWLREQVAEVRRGPKRRLLIATHHAPLRKGTSRPEHANNPWKDAFATDLVGQNCWDGVKVWVFGHTHYTTQLSRNGIKLVANQRGYVFPGERKRPGKKANSGHEYDDAMAITV